MFGIATIMSIASAVIEACVYVGLTVEGIKAVGNAILKIAKALGIVEEKTDVEELGDKAIQAEESGIKPENYENYEMYVNAIKDFKTDPERSAQIQQEDKVKRGTTIASALAAEKCPDIEMDKLFNLLNEENFSKYANAKRFEGICDLVLSDPKTVNNIINFINGTEKSSERIGDAISALRSIEKEMSPELSDLETMKNVLNLQK